MPKLSKEEYIIKAAKLYGLGEVEIGALKDHLSGKMPNDFIVRRCQYLFDLYNIYVSKEYNEPIDPDEKGIINLDDYAFELSKRRLDKSKIGSQWMISSNLEAYMITDRPNEHTDIRNKYIGISKTNNFLLPQIAKQMGLEATVYYKGVYTDQYGTLSTHHLTKNFLNDDETLIQGNSIIKDNPKKRRINFETQLEAVDKFVKKHYKKHKLPQEDADKAREEIKRGLIKQSIFNKFVFNQKESHEKWGLIQGKDKSLRLAPLFSYDYCAGVEPLYKTFGRCVQGKREDIESFMVHFSKYQWFKDWIATKVVTFDLDQSLKDMTRRTGVELSEEEKEYYDFLFGKMHAKVLSVCEVNYDRNLVEKLRKQKLGDKILRIKENVNERVQEIKEIKEKRKSIQDELDKYEDR